MRTLLRETLLRFIGSGGSQRQWAKQNGIDPASLSRMLNEERPISKTALAALGYRKVVTVSYEKIEDGK